MEPTTDAHGSGSGFNMQLELEQLQAKVRLLAGGTDGEQLAEVLLDREEELRAKEGEILELSRKLQAASSDLVAFEADRAEYEVRSGVSSHRCRELWRGSDVRRSLLWGLSDLFSPTSILVWPQQGMIQELDQQLRGANDQIRGMAEVQAALRAERSDIDQKLKNEQGATADLKVRWRWRSYTLAA